jgi:hypothetical protein
MIDIPVKYLLESSRESLRNLRMQELNRSANLNKQLKAVLSEWIETRATAIFLEWLSEHGEEIVLTATEPESLTGQVSENESRPSVAKPFRYEVWRSQQRRERRKAG